jgi:diguanylate cyclase (GGDEF)-like protein
MPDPLTGLEDRAAFLERLPAARHAAHVAVVLVAVDGLAADHGPQAADRATKTAAAALSGALRRGDELFRVGDDEFAAILAVSEPGEALAAAGRLRVAVAGAGSAGVSVAMVVPEADESDTDVLARAGHALRADRHGPVA